MFHNVLGVFHDVSLVVHDVSLVVHDVSQCFTMFNNVLYLASCAMIGVGQSAKYVKYAKIFGDYFWLIFIPTEDLGDHFFLILCLLKILATYSS